MLCEAMMRSSRSLLATVFTAILVFVPGGAHALDIPLLTWERGKEQNLVLGGNTENEWKIELVNEANESVLEFSPSDISANGFVVYSVFIPQDFPLGAYAVQATGLGIPGSIVAGVNVVSLTFYELVQIPFELLWIFLGYLFVTAGFGVMRLRRFAAISVRDSDELDPDLIPPRLSALYRLRERASRNLEPSLFQVLLRREGEWLRTRSLTLWSTLPIAGFVLGLALGIEMLRSGGLGNAPWLLLFFGAMISVIDLYSGMIGFAGFVLAHLIFGDVVSLRDVMALLAVALGWFGAYAIGSVFRILGERVDSRMSKASWITQASLLGGIAAGVVFHAAQILVLSLVVTVSEPASVSWLLSLLVGITVIGKGVIQQSLERMKRDEAGLTVSNLRVEIPIGRVISPRTTGFLLVFFAGTLYIWIRDWLSAIALALALVAPYGLLLIRFAGPRIGALRRIPRSALLESILVTATGYLIFLLLGDLPFEVLERSRLFLILGVIPVIIHSLFSMLWDIEDRAENRDESTVTSIDEEVGNR